MKAWRRSLLVGLEQALDVLAEARAKEGEGLTALFDRMLARSKPLVRRPGSWRQASRNWCANASRRGWPNWRKDAAIDPDRIAQEIVLMATRADVREELDRLAAHVGTARDILKSGEAAGRKLDFLCQELNREANTLCSKSASLELTNAGLALKSLIDQFREQVQNVE